MERTGKYFEWGSTLPLLLAASAILAVVGVVGIIAPPLLMPSADMRLEPTTGAFEPGQTFVISIVVESVEPSNVFAGEVQFDPAIIEVVAIDYNTSIANLWAEKPWYENGVGTINFAGGTTVPGAFLGTGNLITITFRARNIGESALELTKARILRHDGLGSDLPLAEPIDAIVSVDRPVQDTETVATPVVTRSQVAVVKSLPSPDLNGDGKQTIADVSIFMLHLASGNLRSDFNGNGKVGTGDLSIILNQK